MLGARRLGGSSSIWIDQQEEDGDERQDLVRPLSPKRTLRVRPVTVRFTEIGIPDFRVDLLCEIINEDLEDGASSGNDQDDFHQTESRMGSSLSTAVGDRKGKGRDLSSPANSDPRYPDESVRDFKRRIRRAIPSLEHRKLRLIHSGRVLRDGIRLVSWLDSLDRHRKNQAKAFGEEVDSLDAIDSSSSDASPEDIVHDSAPESTEFKAKKGFKGKGKGKAREVDEVDRSIFMVRKAPRVYIQCSVGYTMSSEEESKELGEVNMSAQSAGAGGVENPNPSEATDGDVEPIVTHGVERGFDRLRTAGLTEQEIQEMRQQFYASTGLGLGTSGDILRRQEEEEHARALEEQWIESMGEFEPSSQNLDLTSPGGYFQTILEGLLVGFFFIFLPLFLLKEKAHPSSFNMQEMEQNEDRLNGEEDEEEEENESNLQGRNVVFSPNMQIAIVFGVAVK
ncbi:hypothetical protein IE53DRAFT_366141 [Violaceomyces palustris]|uniref:Uncharacterized protein n=1 Tax=Violaceomyces palustris TaxID=1673888 RepID=A0ACD0P6R7_9BASI|nr:hypothetical protein IE53DRAFT_366141 [Violaceomyces palustris]